MQKPVDPVKFGQRVRERRNDLGLSQPKLAAAAKKAGLRGFSQQNIATLEAGNVIKDLRRQAMDIAELLYTTPEWLLYGTGVKSTGQPMMTGKEFEALPPEVRMHLTEQASNFRKPRKKA